MRGKRVAVQTLEIAGRRVGMRSHIAFGPSMLVGAFVGLRWLGVLGLLFGPLSIAYLFELLHFYREEYESPARVAAAPSPVAAVTAPPITASA